MLPLGEEVASKEDGNEGSRHPTGDAMLALQPLLSTMDSGSSRYGSVDTSSSAVEYSLPVDPSPFQVSQVMFHTAVYRMKLQLLDISLFR